MLEKTLESPLDCKESQPVHSKGDQSWVFFGRNDAKAETPVLWPPHGKSWLIGKDSDAGRDWGQEEKGTREDEMAGWHHWLNGHEFGWTPWVGDGQGGLVCCDSWGHKESDTTEQLNWTELNISHYYFLWHMIPDNGKRNAGSIQNKRGDSKSPFHMDPATLFTLRLHLRWNMIASILRSNTGASRWHFTWNSGRIPWKLEPYNDKMSTSC